MYVPSDGVVDPSDLCRVYTKAATQRGKLSNRLIS